MGRKNVKTRMVRRAFKVGLISRPYDLTGDPSIPIAIKRSKYLSRHQANGLLGYRDEERGVGKEPAEEEDTSNGQFLIISPEEKAQISIGEAFSDWLEEPEWLFPQDLEEEDKNENP